MSNISDPAGFGAPIAPSDTVDIPEGPTRAIWVGGLGNVVADLYGDGTVASRTTVTLTAVPAGSLIPIRAIRVRTTSTATLMVGLR